MEYEDAKNTLLKTRSDKSGMRKFLKVWDLLFNLEID